MQLQICLRRVACPQCGQRMEAVSWLNRHARLTRRLAETVSHGCAQLPTAHVAALFGLNWSTVRLHQRRLKATLATLPTRLVMDEFALYKGDRYATVVARCRYPAGTVDRRRAQPGRDPAVLRGLGARRLCIEAVAMDMNTAFDLEVRQHCPNARVVYDLFMSLPSTVAR